jgi:hypothetical protein
MEYRGMNNHSLQLQTQIKQNHRQLAVNNNDKLIILNIH